MIRKIFIGTIIIVIITIITLWILNKRETKNEETLKNIQIIIYDKNNNIVYSESKSTNEKNLLKVLKSDDNIKLKTETGNYGEFIISIKDIGHGNNYYWNYYVNNNYASVGISNCEIHDRDVFKFKLEKYE